MTAKLTAPQAAALRAIAAHPAGAHHNGDGARYGRAIARNDVLSALRHVGLIRSGIHPNRFDAVDLTQVCRNGNACRLIELTDAGRAVVASLQTRDDPPVLEHRSHGVVYIVRWRGEQWALYVREMVRDDDSVQGYNVSICTTKPGEVAAGGVASVVAMADGTMKRPRAEGAYNMNTAQAFIDAFAPVIRQVIARRDADLIADLRAEEINLLRKLADVRAAAQRLEAAAPRDML
jgi:DNA-binding MarR family transcriptional regulator